MPADRIGIRSSCVLDIVTMSLGIDCVPISVHVVVWTSQMVGGDSSISSHCTICTNNLSQKVADRDYYHSRYLQVVLAIQVM